MKTVYLSFISAFVGILVVSLTLLAMTNYLNVEQIREQLGPFFIVIVFLQAFVIAFVLFIFVRRTRF